jgi:hypothetical protein
MTLIVSFIHYSRTIDCPSPTWKQPSWEKEQEAPRKARSLGMDGLEVGPAFPFCTEKASSILGQENLIVLPAAR